MPIAPGTMLGPYRIDEPVGAGGMGEVYRALDTRLDRTVAIKVLSSHLSSRPDLQSRFEREAKTISSLQHPNVCSLFDVGRENGVDFLVMEYLEGHSLAERLLQGPIPVDELLKIAVQITDALDAAHRRGIVHRDLKPGNVMLAKSGVKLLDFGLAKVAEMAGPPPGTLVSGTVPGALTRPTQSDSLTAEGTILGTFQYMAPEQLEGREADARTDIFALGALLYEMATGRKAFEGKSQASLIASIMSAKPSPISAVQPMAPPALDRVIGTCLQKDPDDRWQTARDVGRELRWIAEGGSDVALPRAVALRRRSRERLAWGAFAGAAAVAVTLAAVQLTRPEPPRPAPMRFTIEGPRGLVSIGSPRLSPDGKFIAFDGTDSVGVKQIWIRPLNDLEAHPLPGTEGTQRPFWSPDSRHIGFIAGGKLKRVPIDGGPPLTLCDTPTGADGNWGIGNVILFDGRPGDSIQVVPAGGGTPGPATRLDRSRHQTVDGWPCFLPDGKRFLYLASFTGAPGEIRLGTLGSLESTKLTNGESRIEIAPGYLIFERSGTLLAQPFDSKSATLAGEAFPLAEGIGTDAVGLAHFSTSQNGLLLYSGGSSHNRQLGWYGREGTFLQRVGQPAFITDPAISPDGLKVAATSWDAGRDNYDIGLIDLRRDITSRFTFASEPDYCPVWSRDGSQIYFASDRSRGLYVKNAGGTGTDQKFLDADELFIPVDISPDGATLMANIRRTATRWDVVSVALDGDHQVNDQIATEFAEYDGRFSPDGGHFSYTSWESGGPEIYISTFPAGGGKWQVSQGGGMEAAWRGDGRELYYLTGDHRLMAVDVSLSPTVEIGAPHLLFHAPLQPNDQERNRYTPSPDGKRFLLSAVPDWDRRPTMTVALNWAEELKRR